MNKAGYYLGSVSFACLLALSQSVKANDAVPSVKEQIQDFSAQGSLSNLIAIETAIEPLWTNAPQLYFQSNDLLLDALASLTEKQPMALQEYEKQSRWVLCRRCPTNLPQAIACFNAKLQVALRLVNNSTPGISNAVALADFLGETRVAIITNYQRAQVYLNVEPPLTPTNVNGMGYFSGMDPAVISDPTVRAAYEKAIEENGYRGEMNDFYITTLPEINRTMTFQFFYYISKLPAKEATTKKQADTLARIAHLNKEEADKLRGGFN